MALVERRGFADRQHCRAGAPNPAVAIATFVLKSHVPAPLSLGTERRGSESPPYIRGAPGVPAPRSRARQCQSASGVSVGVSRCGQLSPTGVSSTAIRVGEMPGSGVTSTVRSVAPSF